MPERVWSVLVADDHAQVRRQLVRMINSDPGFRVVGEASDGSTAVRECERLHPDLVLMDVVMAPVNGVEATRQVCERLPQTKVLALTSFARTEWLIEMLRHGACGYLSKESPPEELFRAMRTVLEREDSYAFSPKVVSLMGRYLRSSEPGRPAPRPQPRPLEVPLTERELELVELLASGLNNHEIALGMHISDSSVKVSLGRIMAKIGVRDRLQVAIRCHELGLVQLGLADHG